MKKQLVIARYREDLAWLAHLPQGWNPLVYHKGPLVAGEPVLGPRLPNIGREAHTYLVHILENWANLADVTAFVQGNPFDGSPNLLVELALIGEPVAPFRYFENNPLVDCKPSPIGSVTDCDWEGSPHHPGLPLREFAERHGLSDGPRLVFAPQANFVVTRGAIQARPRKFYARLLEESGDQLFGYNLERFWRTIFLSR